MSLPRPGRFPEGEREGDGVVVTDRVGIELVRPARFELATYRFVVLDRGPLLPAATRIRP